MKITDAFISFTVGNKEVMLWAQGSEVKHLQELYGEPCLFVQSSSHPNFGIKLHHLENMLKFLNRP
jgi:hypothetical protein